VARTRIVDGEVRLPADYDDPSGPRTRLALTKLPAGGAPDQRLGTLFVNPGGPGGSGVDFVQGAAATTYAPDVLAHYDVLGFDPRGVARSDPATCFPTQADELASPLLSMIYPLPGQEEAQYTREAQQLASRCQETSPRRFASGSTANVARDMDLLRQAVGDERLTYVGYSYGTFLGATYARLFPGRVGRFVLDGTADPIAWSGTGTGDAAPTTPLGIRVRQGIGATETFAEFARLCREGGPRRRSPHRPGWRRPRRGRARRWDPACAARTTRPSAARWRACASTPRPPAVSANTRR
jgi:pimeloyl-ACP methyl ester carboxylesterase